MDPRTLPPLNALPEAEREALLKEARAEEHPPGTFLLDQGGEPAQALYLLLEGSVALVVSRLSSLA